MKRRHKHLFSRTPHVSSSLRFDDERLGDLRPIATAIRSLAELLKIVLLKLHTGLENPDYNLTIDSVPRGEEDDPYFLWHMRIVPRTATTAGFELGSGMAINTVLPEDARDFLSEVPVAAGNGR